MNKHIKSKNITVMIYAREKGNEYYILYYCKFTKDTIGIILDFLI